MMLLFGIVRRNKDLLIKKLLEKQLNNIRAKKDSIIEEANKELEVFKKFQIAAQANPKLTYVEFCKTINNE